MPRKHKNGKKQGFAITAPSAASVMLAGDFTHWQENPISLQKEKAGIWKATVELPPGTYQYRFIVDGEWRDDPECAMHIPNPYGGEDAVRQVT